MHKFSSCLLAILIISLSAMQVMAVDMAVTTEGNEFVEIISIDEVGYKNVAYLFESSENQTIYGVAQ